ncbi:HPr kinase/phosphorylase [Peribacillus sp. Bi96]|uniref:aldolase n=1 Tax=Peribacillus sp. Bi96 TaxID=2884273 RepID=UPI001D3C7183|nr:aldolase [Peribacillus sp. Bi96]CAH0137122.1 HPr kinase/phosphorylase [Peribacillus sp. Bi96]
MVEIVQNLGYRAFGLNLFSEIPLPEVPRLGISKDMTDVEIEYGDLSELWEKQVLLPKQKYVVEDHMVMFQVPGIAIFKIQEGKKITVSPISNSDEDHIRLYILGTCMGIILLQKKVLPLHGSAIDINGKAYAFIGDSGAGKSTLAAAFLKEGFQLLSDDVIPVSLSKDNKPFITPSYPQQKLWQESLQAFGIEKKDYQPLFERETKFSVPVTSSFSNKPLPLSSVFELVKTEHGEVTLQKINQLERFRTLFCHTYRNFLVPRLGLMEWHFMESVNILNKIHMYQLHRPNTGFTVNNLVSQILENINEEDSLF